VAQAAGYSFNAGTVAGSIVRDQAGYFLDGTITGSAAIVAADTGYGNGLHCTGGAMRVANIDQFEYALNSDDGPSVSARVKLDDTTAAARCIFSVAVGSTLKVAMYASNAAGNVECMIAGTTYSSTTSIRDGAYHDLLFVLDKNEAPDAVKIFVDGVKVLHTPTVNTLTYGGTATMDAGRNAVTLAEPLNGIIADLRWWNDPVDEAYVPTLRAAEQQDFQYAIYPFDNDTCDDFSIYGRNLVKAASASYVTGLYGRALSSGSAAAGASGAVNFGDLDRLAVTGWLTLDTAPVGSPAPILAITNSSGTNMLRVVVNTDRTLTATWATIYGSYSVTSGSALAVGQRSRFHFGMNPTYVGMRLNSSTQTITNTSNAIPHLTPAILDLKTLYIGGDAAAGGQVTFDYLNFTRNFVDAPAILYWNGPVMRASTKPANIPRGAYEFDENGGTSAADRSTFANHLTLQTAGGWVTGVAGSALKSDVTKTGPGAAKTSGLAWSATPAGWAVACWAKVHVSASGSRIIVLRNSSQEVAHMGYLSGAMWVRLFGPTNTTTGVINPAAAPITSETWTHLAATCNGDTIQFYVNGVWKFSANYTLGALQSPTILNVGGDGSDNATADVDSLQLFDTPLSRSNVAWLFENPGQFIPAAAPAFQGWGVPL
jgi:hypothetical protein